MIKGKIGSFQNNANSFNLDDLLQIFNFATLLYFNKYAKHSSKFKQNNHETFTEDFNKEMKEYQNKWREATITNWKIQYCKDYSSP